MKDGNRDSLVRVVLPIPLKKAFTYRLPEGVPRVLPGSRVIVPFGSRKLIGFAIEGEGEMFPASGRSTPSSTRNRFILPSSSRS